jgi:hypothetical protein
MFVKDAGPSLNQFNTRTALVLTSSLLKCELLNSNRVSDVFKMKRLIASLAVFFGVIAGPSATAVAAGIEYPQIIRTRYEAVDQKTGGSFVFSERDKIFYGLDAKLFPGARFVEVTQITPTIGSTTLTFVEIRTAASPTSDYIHLTGNVRFRISGVA